ncbi:kelch-like protein 10 [Haemaphysalis longicornis]
MDEDSPTTLATLRTIDGGAVTVPKERLSACSRYFQALFFGPLSKPCQGDYEIPGVSMASLQAIVTFCTTGLVEITVANVQDLTVAADQLLVNGLREQCCAFVSSNMDVDNAVMVLEFAKFYHLTGLFESAFRFLLDNIEFAYSADPDFRKLSLAHLEDLLGSDELKVCREEVVWKVAMLWVRANYKERRRCLATLLPLVRFGLMSSRYLRKVVMRKAFIDGDLSFKVKRCYDLKTAGHNASPADSVRHLFVHRAPAEILFLYGGVCGGPRSDTWELYNHKTNEWSMLRTEFTAQTVFGPQAASIGHKIYVLGTDLNKQSAFNYCFDAVSMKWSPIKPMSQRRALFHAAVIGASIYCIGGTTDGSDILDTVEAYDTDTDTWRAVGRMNQPRLGAAATSCSGRIYVVGGISPTEPLRSAVAYDPATTSEPLRSAEAYDPDTDQWTLVEPMKTGRILPGLVTYRKKIYAIGGLSEPSDVLEVYDPMTGKWSTKSKQKAMRGKVAAAVLNDKIYAIAETNYKDCKRCLEYYSVEEGQWHAMPGSFPMRWFYSACVLRNLPNTLDLMRRPIEENPNIAGDSQRVI